VAVGRGNSSIKVKYEKADGTIETISLGDTIKYILEDTVNRIRQFLFALFPELTAYTITA